MKIKMRNHLTDMRAAIIIEIKNYVDENVEKEV